MIRYCILLMLSWLLSSCTSTPPSSAVAPYPAPTKQACLAPKPYTAQQEAGFAREDEALKASGKFPLIEMRLADYGAERAALRACKAVQNDR